MNNLLPTVKRSDVYDIVLLGSPGRVTFARVASTLFVFALQMLYSRKRRHDKYHEK